MTDDTDDSHYQVGKGRPPKHTRFKTGQSGNPAGRKKRKGLDISEAAERVLLEHIKVTEGGVPKKARGLDALLRSLLAHAAKGNTRAAALLFSYAANDNKRQPPDGDDDRIDPTDDALIRRYYRRYARGRDDDPDPEAA